MGKVKKALVKIAVIAMVACCICPAGTPEASAASKVKLSKTSITLTVGSTKKLKVTGTSKKVKWSSSNKKVATVNKNGKVTAKKKGTATITAKVGKKKLKCKVTVKKAGYALSHTNITLMIDEDASYNDYNLSVRKGTKILDDTKVTMTSSNSSVVKVYYDMAYYLSPKKEGTATITAKVAGKTLKCKVTVVKKGFAKLSMDDYYEATGDVFRVGSKTQLKPVFDSSYKGTTKIVSWKSSNPDVLSVNQNGVITGKKEGNATITAELEGSAYLEYRETVEGTKPSSEPAKYSYKIYPLLSTGTVYSSKYVMYYLKTDNDLSDHSMKLSIYDSDGTEIIYKSNFDGLNDRTSTPEADYTPYNISQTNNCNFYKDVGALTLSNYYGLTNKGGSLAAYSGVVMAYPVDGGYVFALKFATAGTKTFVIEEMGGESYHYMEKNEDGNWKLMRGCTCDEFITALTLDVQDYTSAENAAIDSWIAAYTDDSMNVHEKLTAICEELAGRPQYVRTYGDTGNENTGYKYGLATDLGVPWFDGGIYDSASSATYTQRIAERLGYETESGLTSVVTAGIILSTGHSGIYGQYDGVTYFYSCCPDPENTHIDSLDEVQKIDFSKFN